VVNDGEPTGYRGIFQHDSYGQILRRLTGGLAQRVANIRGQAVAFGEGQGKGRALRRIRHADVNVHLPEWKQAPAAPNRLHFSGNLIQNRVLHFEEFAAFSRARAREHAPHALLQFPLHAPQNAHCSPFLNRPRRAAAATRSAATGAAAVPPYCPFSTITENATRRASGTP
jgi:hypothetical protein